MKYVVAIPSYRRAEILKTQTLATLIEGGVPESRIHVFVANHEEEQEYRKVLSRKVKVVKGVLGITEQRAFIRAYFPIGTCILSVDDDVQQVLMLNKNKLVPMPHLATFIEDAFRALKERKLGLWGVFPTPNVFYMEGQAAMTTNLKFVIGTFYGFINSKDIKLGPIKEKEDVETTLQYFIRDGGVLRFNWVSFKTRFKNPKGGLGGLEGRFEANKEAAAYLLKKYPEYTRLKIRKNGMHEIVLKKRTKSDP